jgi:hypothetical protein
MNDGLRKSCMEMTVAYFNAISQHLPIGTRENRI